MNPFTDEHAEDRQLENDVLFVVGEDEDVDDKSSKHVSIKSPVKERKGDEEEYQLEPYETMRHKVLQLMPDLFPDYRADDVKTGQMHDGEHNRIIEVTLCKTPRKAPWYSTQGIREMMQPCLTSRRKRTNHSKQFVLRIPRNSTQNMHHQVTTLAYLGYKLGHPIPKVTVFDAGADNALGRAYMLQERLPGRPLSDLWPTLNQAQRLSSILAISNIILDMGKIKNKCPGLISIRNTTYDLKRDVVSNEPIPIPRTGPTTHLKSVSNSPSEPQSSRNFLLDLCARQRAYAAAAKRPACNDLWGRIIKMIETLYSLALTPDSSPFHLYHGNFQPRNLLASIASESTVEITGIMDWDLALFAPAFLSTSAPFFMWNGGIVNENADGAVLLEPDDAEFLEAKRTFESVVGESFLKEAYCPELVLARRLWNILLGGFANGRDIFFAEEIVEEFERLHPVVQAERV
ncbi:hypothetical protein G6011_02052 [Alternaria panax]|uniref:Aminoglycoside phosphotransferase domain-containing protein n=1 Tax=Alternaria panax TaxID=48097 RepID=A0AAD4I987_9PLEO|nr:hypothetical protein G6011_02052 [Alternaria panax]